MSEANSNCKEPALLLPVIDRHRCEGKADCLRVCPYDVFELSILDGAQRAALPFLPRLKARFHGWRQAFAVRADQCRACGLCVEACPEKAITLVRAGSAGDRHG
jgi:4Fe-4S ferredoxin